MWSISRVLLIIVGFSSGFMVSAGVFTVLFVVALVPRLAGRTDTAKFERIYENCIICGTVIGTLFSVFPMTREIGKEINGMISSAYGKMVLWWGCNGLLTIFGFFTGIFVGCLALAAAELFDALPIMIKREHVKKGTVAIVTSIAFGKLAGALYFYWVMH